MDLSFNDHYYLEESLIVIVQYVCRFGAAVSPLVQTAELSEAIKRRQERFGVVTKDEPKAKKVTMNAGVNSIVLDEKMQKRKERFGL